MKLERLEIEFDDELELPNSVANLIESAKCELMTYWDQWQENPIEQFVACDFEYVARALVTVGRLGLSEGSLFCEWGAGFGVVTGIASVLGWDAIGIEAEEFLVERAKQLLIREKITAEIWQGNFLPKHALNWADSNADHASLFHRFPPAYDKHDLSIEDFAMIFAYPWPGEHHFIEEVFRRTARENALLMVFKGPYELELFRQTT